MKDNQRKSGPHPVPTEANLQWRKPGMQEVTVQSGADAESAIEEAIAAVIESAEHYETGILVTRIGQDTYIVRVHPTVPYGLVRQSL